MPRKEKKHHFTYKTTNLLNGKYYIGMHSTDNLEDGYLGSGKRLRYSINKHGKDNHVREILEYFETREELAAREKEIVSLNEVAKELCMNLVVGGEGGFHTEQQQINCSKAGQLAHINKLKNDPEYRKKAIERFTAIVSNAHKLGKYKYDNNTGKSFSEEHKKKIGETMSIKQKGKLNSQYGTTWITKDGENKKIKKDELNKWINDGWLNYRDGSKVPWLIKNR